MVILGCVLFVWFLLSLIYSFSGSWIKSYPKEISADSFIKEKIELNQFGPFVAGRADIIGNKYQLFFGYSIGPKLWLKRRDYGEDVFVKQGFSKKIAIKLDGQIMARYVLMLSRDRLFLEGIFIPYKILFTHNSSKITIMPFFKPVKKIYQRAAFVSKKIIVNL